jgi:hypothetical protein
MIIVRWPKHLVHVLLSGADSHAHIVHAAADGPSADTRSGDHSHRLGRTVLLFLGCTRSRRKAERPVACRSEGRASVGGRAAFHQRQLRAGA